MRILIISSYVPYPLHSGGQVRLYNLIRELSGRHEITLIAEKRSKQVIDDVTDLEKICKKLIIVPSPKQWSLKNVLKAVTSNHSFLLTGHTNAALQQKIMKELENNKFDLIHVETFYVMQNLPKTPLPVVLAEHNIEYLVYEKYMERVPLPLRPLLALDIAKIKREEESAWKRVSRLVAVSEEDKKVMERAGLRPSIVANGVNTDLFSFKSIKERSSFASAAGKEGRILFIGDFKWIQNQDTASWIIKEIWPMIRQESGIRNQESGIKLWIVGRTIPDSIKNLTKDPDVLFDEKSSVKPTPRIFQEASLLLAPIRVGGGTSYKILESIACGTPVITMQLSANAIGAVDGKEILVGNTASELAKKTMMVLQNKELYEKVSSNGRMLIEKHYTWKSIAKKLEEVYREAI